MEVLYQIVSLETSTSHEIQKNLSEDDHPQLYDTVTAIVIATTRKGVILRFNGNQEGFAYGGYTINTKVLASIQKIRDGFTPRLSVDSVIAYPGAA